VAHQLHLQTVEAKPRARVSSAETLGNPRRRRFRRLAIDEGRLQPQGHERPAAQRLRGVLYGDDASAGSVDRGTATPVWPAAARQRQGRLAPRPGGSVASGGSWVGNASFATRISLCLGGRSRAPASPGRGALRPCAAVSIPGRRSPSAPAPRSSPRSTRSRSCACGGAATAATTTASRVALGGWVATSDDAGADEIVARTKDISFGGASLVLARSTGVGRGVLVRSRAGLSSVGG